MDIQKAQATLEQFADYLKSQQEEISQEWTNAIHSDGRLQTCERLTAGDLREHLPRLFDNLTALLRTPANRSLQEAADENARLHGSHRFQQGYRLDELLVELGRIRSVLIAHTLAFEERTPDFTGVVKRVAMQRLHGFFDRLISDSAAQFVRDQQMLLRKDLAQVRVERTEAAGERDEAQMEVEKLQEVDASRLRLLRTVAHELRNSVNAAQLIAEGLDRETDQQAHRELTSILARNIQHMGALLKDLLEYALALDKSPAPRTELVDVRELCGELASSFRPLAQAKGLTFETDCDPMLNSVASHRTKLIQIATNLLSNAVKYTPAGFVRLRMRTADENRWALEVEDSGSGISPEERECVFTEFHRSQPTRDMPGTGLGLAIVKRLTDLLGGEILVHSELGKGSRFTVLLPFAAESSRA